MCSLRLSGDDSGEATLEEVEEKFGGIEEVRGFMNAVRAQSEAIMTAVVQQGTHTARPAAHSTWSRISDSLGQLKDINRLRAYVPALSHCVVTDLTDAQQLSASKIGWPDSIVKTQVTRSNSKSL